MKKGERERRREGERGVRWRERGREGRSERWRERGREGRSERGRERGREKGREGEGEERNRDNPDPSICSNACSAFRWN